MVDALDEAHRVLAPNGTLVDARPDSRVFARVRRAATRRVIGFVSTQRDTKTDDSLADRAVRIAVRRALFRSVRRGRFWHALPFSDAADLQGYLDDHARFSRRVRWSVSPSSRSGALLFDRAIRFEILSRRQVPSTNEVSHTAS